MNRLLLPICLLSIFLLAACAGSEGVVEDVDEAVADFDRTAVAIIQPLNGGDLSGRIVFEETEDYVRISGEVHGLSTGKHGFHIHAGMSCEDMGGHYNPEGAPHGSPDEQMHHVGDLGNLVANDDGLARYEALSAAVTLSGPQSVVGHALIVHETEDQYLPQPSGSAGPEIGCGVIELQEE